MAEGAEWEPWGGLGDNAAAQLQAFVDNSPLARRAPEPVAPAVAVPDRLPVPDGAEQSTQAAFGRILLDLAKSGEPLADRIVQTAPAVTQTTNMGGFVHKRGLLRRQELGGGFKQGKITEARTLEIGRDEGRGQVGEMV